MLKEPIPNNYNLKFQMHIFQNPKSYIIKELGSMNAPQKHIEKLTVNYFQNELHKLINSFMDGSLLSRYSKYFYPWIERYSLKLKYHLNDIYFYLNILEKYFNYNLVDVLKKVEDLLQSKNPKSIDITDIISLLYSKLEYIINLQSNTKKILVKCKKDFVSHDYISKDSEYLKPVLKMAQFANKFFNKHTVGFYIHGSLSTLDYIKGISDFDTLMIIKRDTILNKQLLYELKSKVMKSLRFLYMIDPFQHHGHFIITEIDMKYYPQIYFPFILFNYSIRVIGEKYLTFYERDSEVERKNLLWKMCTKGFNTPQDLYSMKYFLSIIQLIPTIYLQSVGKYSYKKYSFEKVKKILNNQNWQIVEKATKIRQNWPWYCSSPERLVANIIPNPFFLALYYRKLKNKIPSFIIEILGKDYPKETLNFKKRFISAIEEKL